MRIRLITTLLIIAASLAALGPATFAQSSEDHPARRAMERINAVVGARAVAADRALSASKLVNESSEARKRGNMHRLSKFHSGEEPSGQVGRPAT
jgi:hypothetical protein